MKRCGAAVLLVAILAVGCGGGPATGKLSGKVTVNGKPLPNGMIMLVVDGKANLIAGIQDGAYSIEKVPVGKASIGVRETQPAVDSPITKPEAGKPPITKTAPPPSSMVPSKYERPETSGLSTTIAKGANEFNIDIK